MVIMFVCACVHVYVCVCVGVYAHLCELDHECVMACIWRLYLVLGFGFPPSSFCEIESLFCLLQLHTPW